MNPAEEFIEFVIQAGLRERSLLGMRIWSSGRINAANDLALRRSDV